MSKTVNRKMKRKSLATVISAALIFAFSSASLAARADDEDTDTRLVNAKVVEVTEGHVSVMSRVGVEHVIAVDGSDTKVVLGEKIVSLKDLREGDVVIIELDEVNPLKFARNIAIAAQGSSQVARMKP